MRYEELTIEGRNAVIEAFRSGKPIDKLFVLDGCQDGPVRTIIREAKKHDTLLQFVAKERLDQMSETGRHQGVIACAAAYEYAEVDDILKIAEEKGEPPFLFLLDGIEDPHNLGAIIRTANLAGAHGVIIPKRRAVGLTATVAKTSAGALNYTPVAKVTNLAKTIEELKQKGIWFVCADMNGTPMYDLDLKGPIGLVIGSEGEGVSRLVRENCDFIGYLFFDTLNQTFEPCLSRVCDILYLYLTKVQPKEPVIPLSKGELAKIAGASQAQMERCVQILKKEEVLATSRKQLAILDEKKLLVHCTPGLRENL